MNKEVNNKLVPKLRFKEFENYRWIEKPLEKILKFQTGYPFESKWFNKEGKGIRLIKNRDLKSDDNIVYYSNSFDDKFLVNKGDILIGMDGDFTPIVWNKGLALLNQRVGRIITNCEGEERFYLYFLTIQLSIIEQKTPRTTVKHLSHSDVEKINELLPESSKEQQKIADCLSSLDDLISAENEKLDALKEHKKGLMQQLFPAEGEKVPKLRFPEFKDSGEWEEKSLDEICKLVRGPFGGALKKEIFVKDGFAVYEQFHAIYEDFSSFRYYIDNEKFSQLKRFSVNSGDLIMSCSGTMGKFAKIPEDFKQGVINQALLKLSVKEKKNSDFIKLSLELPLNQDKLLSQSAGGAIKNVVAVDQIRELKLYIPKTQEQQKIANFFSSLNEQITIQSKKIEDLRLHKKGLMQGLFPQVN